MAKIVQSDLAPEDAKTLTTAQGSYEVPFETDNPDVLDNVRVHPWFEVEADQEPAEAPPSTATYLPAELDPFSRLNTQVDKDVDTSVPTHEIAPVALDAALDQGEAKDVDGIAVTTAAAEEAEPVAVADLGSNASVVRDGDAAKPKTSTSKRSK